MSLRYNDVITKWRVCIGYYWRSVRAALLIYSITFLTWALYV